ncbi:MAG: hypothetical protein FE78DRAFT_444383 [Acidomyces sp. 'richmondensis']|nr:MAG: hypothetical protein FE78DRAFT_444383 [Acidomyces sp. 'richmondensis']
MSDLYELLAPYFHESESPSSSLPPPSASDPQTEAYLNRLSTLSLSDLTSTEPASLLHAEQSHLRNLQALSKRSHKAIIASSSHLANLTSLLPSVITNVAELKKGLPQLESAAKEFAEKYDRNSQNAALDRRKQAMLLSRNVDRVLDVLELPTLLSSAVAAGQVPTPQSGTGVATSYALALDLHSHIKRLHALYPQSELVSNILKQAEVEIKNLTNALINSLQSPSLKLAAAMRTIGLLRRVAPDLADDGCNSSKPLPAFSARALHVPTETSSVDGALGSLFLVCRLNSLYRTLEALEPLRELADQETTQRIQTLNGVNTKQSSQTSVLGTQTERYLKRYIEIFREQSFSIVSMYKSIFPSGFPSPEVTSSEKSVAKGVKAESALLPLPSPISSFALHVIDMLIAQLRQYMPNVTEKQARESLLTQVLYCAGSLGRQGADFSMMIALLDAEFDAQHETVIERVDNVEDPEWVEVMKKHRIQAGRLEILARGVGTVRKGSEVQSNSAPPVT